MLTVSALPDRFLSQGYGDLIIVFRGKRSAVGTPIGSRSPVASCSPNRAAPLTKLVTGRERAKVQRVELWDETAKSAALQKELEALFARQNRSGIRDATSIPATFLQVTVHV